MLRRTKESIDLNKKANKLIEDLKEQENTKLRSEGNQLVLIRGEALELELLKHLESAKDKISIMVSRERLLRWVAINNLSIQNALKRNVTVRIITEEFYGSNDSRVLQALERWPNFEHRYAITPLEVWLRLYDDKEILLTTSTKLGETNPDTVFSNNPSLVELAQTYFSTAWFSASVPQSQAFKRDRRQFDYLFANLNSGFSYNKIVFGSDGKPVDFVILETNLAFKRITGVGKNILGERGTNVFSSGVKTDLVGLLATYWPIISHGKSARFDYRFQGSERCFSILAYSPEKGYFVSIFDDITELKQQENKIKSLSKFPSENPLPILRINGAGTILYGNEAALSLLTEWSSQVNKRAPEDICQLVSDSLKSNIKIELEQTFGAKVFSLLFAPVSLEDYVNIYANDITERKKAEQELEKSELKYRSIFENSEAGMFRTKLDGSEILDCNEKFLRIFGRSRTEIIGKSSQVLWADPLERRDMVSQLKAKGFVEDFECKMLNKQGETRLCITALKLYPDEEILEGSIIDITERNKAETEREIMIEFLRITSVSFDSRDLIKAAVGFFQKQSGCEAVGVRLKDGDDFPYYETRGFPPEHVLLENKLCATDVAGCVIRDFKGDPVIECMCGNILCGRFDPSKEFFTEKGSFWANNTMQLLASTTDADRQIRTRNRCNGEGYESVALIALRVGNERLGLLQLNDKRKNMFSLELIQMWERIADHLALALSRTLAEEALREKDEKFRHLAEYAPAAIYEIDCKSLRFKSVNDFMCALSGYSEKELLSMSPFDLLNAESKDRFQEIIRKSAAGEKIDPKVEFGLITKDGRLLWATLSAKLTYKNNELDCAFVVAHDITERKKSEELLKESESKYVRLFNTAEVGMFRTKLNNSEILECNEKLLQILGYTREEMLGRPAILFYVDAGQRQELAKINQTKGELVDSEINLFSKLGKVKTCLLSSKLYPDEGILEGSIIDITERKEAEEALVKSEANYRNLLNGMSETAWVIDFERNFIDVNDAAVKVLGYSKEELLRIGVKGIDKNLRPEDAKSLLSRLVSVGAQVFETVHTAKDGKKIPVEISSSLITYYGKQAILSIARNITERKKAEQALIESEERFRKAFSTSPDAFMITTLSESLIVECNDAFLEMFGYSRQEVMDKRALDLNLWADPSDRERIALLLKKEGKVRNKESFYRRKNGEIFPVLFSVSLLETNNQQLSLITARDISVTKKMRTF
jgi:PAS domain S-box-containing protein